MKVWINGKILDSKNAKISVFDRGFLYGDGVFDTMRSYDGVVFRLEDHLTRLEGSLRATRISIPYSKEKLVRAIRRLLKINRLKDAYIRVSASRGEGRPGLDIRGVSAPTVVIMTKPFVPYPEWMYKNGIKAKLDFAGPNELSPVSRIKSMNFLNNILAKLEAKEAGFDEVIFMNAKGRVSEASASNIFLISGKKLITPKRGSGILAGVTRKIVLSLAGPSGLLERERSVSRGELLKADEVFLTNSLAGIVPVVNIDGHRIGSGRPGEAAASLGAKYKELTKNG